MDHGEDILLLFDHPNEPIFMEKGSKSTVFDVPENFLTTRYRLLSSEVHSRFGEKAEIRIPVRDIKMPDLTIPMSLSRDDNFSVFIPYHRRIAGHLIDIFMEVHSLEDLKSVAVYAHDRLNPYLFIYALSVALLHRKDTKGLLLPPVTFSFPAKFVDSQVFRKMREEITVVSEGSRVPIVVPRAYTASPLNPEHRLWYFREDMGVNSHHWHWHLVYPFEASDRKIVAKDRRGELLYYMHHQMVARYNFERFSNDLPQAQPLNNFRVPINEGYFPKMDSFVASRAWPPRSDNTKISDLRREADQIILNIADMELWRDRILEAIQQDYAIDVKGNRIPLDENRGIDVLGDIIESSINSPNRPYYGDFHNMGHVFIAYAHDPDHRHLESFGVMGDSATAMRDPIFYRWHTYVDNIFDQHKIRLPPYTWPQLSYDGVTVINLEVKNEAGQENTFTTFWQQSDVNFSRGLDFAPRGNVYARYTHLQHSPFTYTVTVNNNAGTQRFGMIRIFMGPKKNEKGEVMPFNKQRLLMIEMDKFVVSLHPGMNTIRRRSTESNITIPFERTFRNLDMNRPPAGTVEELEYNICGCGWPHHMLVPKGKLEGLECQLFVMVSNYEDDRIDQELLGSCGDASSYCGVRDRLYPDRRAMGFPFDRLSRSATDVLVKFLTPNMFVRDVIIRHENRTTLRPI